MRGTGRGRQDAQRTKAFHPAGTACHTLSPFLAIKKWRNQHPPSGRTLPWTRPSSAEPCASPQTTLISTFGVGCAELISEALRSWYDASTILCSFGRSIHLSEGGRRVSMLRLGARDDGAS